MHRKDDYEKRREHLKNLDEEELIKYFWELTEKIVDPLVELARTHTSPSIERSVLLRMGFSSVEAKKIVERMVKENLLGHGAGRIVLLYSELSKKDYLKAGKELSEGIGWDKITKYYRRRYETKARQKN